MPTRKSHSQKKSEKQARRAKAKRQFYSVSNGALIGVLVVLTVLALYSSTAYTTGTTDRGSTIALSDDATGAIGISPPAQIPSGGVERLVTITNNFNFASTITITLTGTTATNGDIIVGGVNQGDSASVTLAAAGSQQFDIDLPNNAFQDSPATFTITSTGNGITGVADRTVPIVNSGGGGGGGGGNAANLQLVANSGQTGVNGQASGVLFQFQNTGTTAVTITDISVNAGGPAKQLVDAGGGTGSANREVFIDVTSNSQTTEDPEDGYLDVGSYALKSTAPLTQTATIQAGDTGTVYLYEFQRNNGNGVNMNGRSIDVTFTASDGSTVTLTFTS